MPSAAPPSEPPAWSRALERFLGDPDAPSGEPQGGGTRLALQFEVRELIPRTASRWNGPTSRALRPLARSGEEPDGEVRLGVRPAVASGRGWARGGLTWSNLPHMLHRLTLDPAQHRWCCEFAALHRAATPPTVGHDPDWVLLDEFENPVLWALLDQAAALGIPLVGPTGRTAVQVGRQAGLTLDAVRSPAGLRVAPRLRIDGETVDIEHAGAIGSHGLYAFDRERLRRILIAPAPLSAEQLAILRHDVGTGRPVLVPEDGIPAFRRRYLPELQRRIDVESSDGALEVPEPPPPALVLTAAFRPRHTLELSWRWERHRPGLVPPPLRALLPDDRIPDDWLPDAGDPERVPPPRVLRDADAAEFAAAALPALESLDGVRVEIVGTRPAYHELEGPPTITVTAVPTEKHDWFDLGVTVTVDGRSIPFVPLFRALASGRRRLLLVDGSYISLAHRAFARLRELIEEAQDLDEWQTGLPRISRHQVDLWSAFEDLADELDPADEWRELLAEVRDAPQPVAPPAGLAAELRPYQTEGFHWLAFLWRHRLGGILADDMGLGKTVQCLALVQHAAESGGAEPRRPFLIVAPTSVVPNWAAEAARFTPGLVVRTVRAVEGPGGPAIADIAEGADIVVTSYALLRLDADAYRTAAGERGWAGLVLDEAQMVKNPGSQVHAAARGVPAPFRLAVTGTPMENSLTDLHALFAIVAPGLLPSARRFAEEYVRPVEGVAPGISRGPGSGRAAEVSDAVKQERIARLRRRIRPFMLRRTKELVASELPAKQEQILSIELAPAHRALYDVYLQRERRKLFGLLEDLDRNRFTVFRSLTLLRLLALDASLLGEEHQGLPSSKLDALLEQLDDVLAEGHRALVFSQFTSYLAKAAARLEAAGIPYAYLDGSTRRRSEVIDGFRGGGAPVFLISLKAGGSGINLTEADYVFLLDPWWNPASEEQAIDRTHRIGQERTVMVYRLIAAGTIEEKVMQLKERKAALVDAVIDDEALFGSALSADDIRDLLA